MHKISNLNKLKQLNFSLVCLPQSSVYLVLEAESWAGGGGVAPCGFLCFKGLPPAFVPSANLGFCMKLQVQLLQMGVCMHIRMRRDAQDIGALSPCPLEQTVSLESSRLLSSSTYLHSTGKEYGITARFRLRGLDQPSVVKQTSGSQPFWRSFTYSGSSLWKITFLPDTAVWFVHIKGGHIIASSSKSALTIPPSARKYLVYWLLQETEKENTGQIEYGCPWSLFTISIDSFTSMYSFNKYLLSIYNLPGADEKLQSLLLNNLQSGSETGTQTIRVNVVNG